MHFCKLKQVIILPLVAILITTTILGIPLGQDRYVYSQSSETNSTASSSSGVDLINTRPSPSNVKAGSNFEIFSTVANNSTNVIMFSADDCESPLSAYFMRNVLVRSIQGCIATSSPFKLNPGEVVSVAGPGSGTIYQAIKAGQTPATATFYYQTENGHTANVTKPFVFTIK
jgi:hypothetical protein